MQIQGKNFRVLDVYNESITIPDSFAAPNNKFGSGHGEAKLYIGTKTKMNNFFGQSTSCFVLKDDFENYRNGLLHVQPVLSSIYKNSIGKNKRFSSILNNINLIINGMQNIEYFNIKLMNNLSGQRGYINTTTKNNSGGYFHLRSCCIPFATYIRILKLEDAATGNILFYIKLFPNFDEMYEQVQYIRKYGRRSVSSSHATARTGQAKYKRELVQIFNECPFSHIMDERILVASHILPYASCNSSQKYDPENGLLLSPLYDKLFDKGFITFDQQGNLRKTIWLSSAEWEKIPLNYNLQDLHLTNQRKAYLQFHETYVFLGD